MPLDKSWRDECLEADKYGPEVDRTINWVQHQALQFIAQNWRELDNYFHTETPNKDSSCKDAIAKQVATIQTQVIGLFRNFLVNRRLPNATSAILVLAGLFQCTIIAWTPPGIREVFHVSRRYGKGKSKLPPLQYAKGYDHNAYRVVQVYQYVDHAFKVTIVDPMVIFQRPQNYPRQIHIEHDSSRFHWSPMLVHDESNTVPLPRVVHKLWNEFSKQGSAIKHASNQIITLQGTVVNLEQQLVQARSESSISFHAMEVAFKSQAELNATQNKLTTNLMINMQKKIDNLLQQREDQADIPNKKQKRGRKRNKKQRARVKAKRAQAIALGQDRQVTQT